MDRTVLASQNVSRMCLVCGAANPVSLKAQFLELEGGDLLGVFRPLEVHQSYPGRLHGGISSAILDETIGRAIIVANPGIWGVTVEFNVRYRQPVPLDGEIRAVGRITRDTTRLFEGTGEILLADGSVAVEGRGKYVKLGIEDIAEARMDEREWFADRREAPASVELSAPAPGSAQ